MLRFYRFQEVTRVTVPIVPLPGMTKNDSATYSPGEDQIRQIRHAESVGTSQLLTCPAKLSPQIIEVFLVNYL